MQLYSTGSTTLPAEPVTTDEELMAAVQRGDRDAYQALYTRWSKRIHRFLLRRTGALHIAEEAHQEAWLRVYRYRHNYQAGRPFSPWLFRIAANAGNRAYEPAGEDFVWEPRAEDHPHLRDYLVRALGALDEGERKVLLLSVEGFNSTEIGGILDLKPSAVRMRLKRARERVKQTLGGFDER